jgi:hypothetical protein
LVVTADALSVVTIDLLERIGFPYILGKEWSPENDPRLLSLEQARERTVERLTIVAQRLAEAGDVRRALLIDGQVDTFESEDLPMATYTPDLGLLTAKDGTPQLERPMADVRQEVSWLVDQLRPDPIAVNEYGTPTTAGAPHPAEYRWGYLFDSGDDTASAWDRRFAEGSWLRRIFDRAEKEIRAIFGLEAPATPG